MWGIRTIIIHFSLIPTSHTELVPISVFNLPVIKFSETTSNMSSLPKLRCITHTGTKYVWLWCFERPLVLVDYLNLFDVFKLWFSSLPFSLFSQIDGWGSSFHLLSGHAVIKLEPTYQPVLVRVRKFKQLNLESHAWVIVMSRHIVIGSYPKINQKFKLSSQSLIWYL